MRTAILSIAGVCASAMSLGAQTPDVDFPRDVQPIFREHCYGCHGPELQMNGFRLDRRADAMRGGQQTNIGPGNADGSRMYQRIAGTAVGARMPPAGPLGSNQIGLIKRWIDAGAHWPDAASGELPVPPSDLDATRLIEAIRLDDAPGVAQALSNASIVAKRGARGMTPLMAAAMHGQAALVRRMLALGADPNARSAGGVTALMLAVPAVEKMWALLDAGADANARSDDGRTPVLIAAGTSGSASALTLLLENGADPFPWRASEPSPLREAARVGDADTFRLLLAYGLGPRSAGAPPANFLRINCVECATLIGAGGPLPKQPPDSNAAATSPVDDSGRNTPPIPARTVVATAETIGAAVARSLPRLQQIDIDFVRRTGCVSCHHNSLVSMAVAAAKANGYRVDDGITASQSRVIGTYLESWRERVLQNIPIAGGADTMSYLLFGLAESGYAPDAATDAQALWLKRRQSPDGRWPLGTLRPPIESNDIEVTAVSMRALQQFAPASQHVEYQQAVERARAWLTTAHAETTEERAFRLLGLAWSQASAPVIARAAQELVASQRPDGGWSQEAAMTSDAYAAGQALVALRQSGVVGATDPVFRRGIEYLLRTQYDDGTWRVETHAVPIQPYFESGFPYGVHQWISAAASAWATTALALAR